MTPLRRSDFPVIERWRYLDHAGVAPLPRRSAAALSRYADAMRDGGGPAGLAHEAREPAVRRAGAAVMGVSADDVVFVKNTTEGLSLVAAGLDWQAGDRVLVPACEFPSNRYPWLALADRGVVVTLLQAGPDGGVPLGAFERELGLGGVRAVAVSWVQYGCGYRLDLAALGELCRHYRALLCVDAIQGLGVIPAEFGRWGVTLAAADGHKWMLGPEGIGLAYINPEHRDGLHVTQPGWNCVPHRGDWDNPSFVLDDTARRFEGGTPNRGGILALGESLDLLLEAGIPQVWDHVSWLCQRLADGIADIAGVSVLSNRSPHARSGIVTFSMKGHAATDISGGLVARGFAVAPRGGGVRVAPHGYNTGEEIDLLLNAIAELATR